MISCTTFMKKEGNFILLRRRQGQLGSCKMDIPHQRGLLIGPDCNHCTVAHVNTAKELFKQKTIPPRPMIYFCQLLRGSFQGGKRLQGSMLGFRP